MGYMLIIFFKVKIMIDFIISHFDIALASAWSREAQQFHESENVLVLIRIFPRHPQKALNTIFEFNCCIAKCDQFLFIFYSFLQFVKMYRLYLHK